MSVSGIETERQHRRRTAKADEERVHYSRWFWPSFTLPAGIWLMVLFLLPLYTVVSIAFGTVDPIFRNPLPIYQPWWWSGQQFAEVFQDSVTIYGHVYLHTFEYVVLASIVCLVIAYAVAYYVARYGGKRKALLLSLLIAPFFISYLMRMVAWINLLDTHGYVNRLLTTLHLIPQPVEWLGGLPFTVVMGLVYGYIPYMILPLYAFLDRIDPNLMEAGRDLGAGPARTFLRVTLPLSLPGVAAAFVFVFVPTIGEFVTPQLVGGTKGFLFGNAINDRFTKALDWQSGSVMAFFLLAVVALLMAVFGRFTQVRNVRT